MSKVDNKDLLKFLKPLSVDITETVLWLRDFVWDLYPQTNELIYDNYNAVAFGWSQTKWDILFAQLQLDEQARTFTLGFIGGARFQTRRKYFWDRVINTATFS